MKLRHFLRKLRRDRKGVAIEMAIMMVVITFALTTLVLTTSLLMYTKQTNAEVHMAESAVLEQIGRSFCDAVARGDTEHTWIDLYPDYTITLDALTLTVAEKDGAEVRLTVELSNTDGVYTIVKWNQN